jgi:hypothetical protein
MLLSLLGDSLARESPSCCDALRRLQDFQPRKVRQIAQEVLWREKLIETRPLSLSKGRPFSCGAFYSGRLEYARHGSAARDAGIAGATGTGWPRHSELHDDAPVDIGIQNDFSNGPGLDC